jgi:hypothetical protein
VQIVPHGKGGTIQIEYFTADDLNRLLDLMLKE